ncbi:MULTISPECIES: AAA-like domain-containing protein [unclassified Coleofasciculus]|uniref:AAA-like domain-containing protein n=1 Tax=unclassified Coleofasciculus TaxID=2692782 RepID=UPI0018820649|nr:MULTISPECIES: AAA-like domain-containing protein [unclassified Coleofasciculus]MBE9129748.1 AAA-like domain-containing protein [Coleofasciculus sp. LEGE 07081]MBE9152233.1 AAA-like domain-containing protein [Coleofasciculus sp. LEGE 07092]
MEPIENVALPSQLRGESALAAIVFTDVESFTTKMAADEKHTLTLIQRDFELMSQVCQRFEGHVLKTLGDGLLMYFVSAEKAVLCAVEIQTAFATAAAQLSERDVLKHRIGIYLGEVLFSGNDVMGNGVNVAARLQGEATPGGVCISQTVYDVVKNRLRLPITYMGLRKLRGIQEPMPVYQITPPRPQIGTHQRVFISYRTQNPDFKLAETLCATLTKVGHEVFMAGENIRLGENWPQRIEAELKQCDYLLLLLSEQSAISEMVTEEVRRAKELRDAHPESKPVILPIRVNFPLTSPLNYNLRGYLDRIQQREWYSDADTPTVIQEILSILAEGRVPEDLTESGLEIQPAALDGPDCYPLPSAVPELPEGQVDLASVFYVERSPIELRASEAIIQPGALIRIKATRQMGKTSLMARILYHASQQGYRTVALNLQLAEGKVFKDIDKFLRWFCASVGRRLRLPNQLNEYWDEIFGSKDNCTAYFEEYLLENIDSPLVLGLDEVDCLFQYPEIAADFFGLLRAWHEDAKNRDIWKKLRLVVVHSTEVYVPMDINQSPFNVGLSVELPEFTPQQVFDLASLHGLDWQVAQVEQLMAMVAGHPYLVRLALYHIARQDIGLEELLKTAPTEAGLYSDHLRRHLWNLQQHPELAAAIQQVVTATAPVRLESAAAFKLHSMGLVDLQGNEVKPRCDLYCQYFRDRLKGECYTAP